MHIILYLFNSSLIMSMLVVTLEEVWFDRKPWMSQLIVHDSVVYVLIQDPKFRELFLLGIVHCLSRYTSF